MKRRPNNLYFKKPTKRLSLYPLNFEEAISDLLKVKPGLKEKTKRKKA
jgi:hypothetical protein